MTNADDEYDLIMPSSELTWLENHVWAWIGYGFCEVSFRTPNWLWWALGWTHSVGNFFYGLAFNRWHREHHGDNFING